MKVNKQTKLTLGLSILVAIGAVGGFGMLTQTDASAATQSSNTNINATVSDVITISTTADVAVNITPTTSGQASSNAHNVTVSTNYIGGYNLQLSVISGATNTNLNKSGGGTPISAHTGTAAAPSQLATNSWGYRVEGGTFGAGNMTLQTNVANLSGNFAGVPASGSSHTIKTVNTPVASDVTAVLYGVKANSSIETGVYTNTVVYTATTN